MGKRLRLGEVSLRQLNRDPGGVFERVRRGERLIVLRHKRPIATIQPVDGFSGQPLIKRETSIDGSPLGDVSEETDRLTDVERSLLVDAVGINKIHPARLSQFGEAVDALKEMELRGLVRKSPIGWVLRGRGMMLREVLLARAGLREEDTWRIRGL
ncbi:MAG: type II toxin-antitoxin system Phd/YefM family antitoxin [Actinomycetota bacterium]